MISVNLSSLQSESLNSLAAIGLLPSIGAEDEKNVDQGVLRTTQREVGTEIIGQPWFEDLIEGSELGRLRRRRGRQTSADGKTRVEWEVVEFDSDGPPDWGTNAGKRKHGDSTGDEDMPMREGH